MGKTLEKGAGLGLRQKQFLALVLEEAYILNNFYLSGGTALSSWYLHHRESYDLDFFTDRPFDGDKIAAWVRQHEYELDYQSVSVDDDFGFYAFLFRYKDNSRFKVDFAHYTSERLEPGLKWRGLTIDSLYDIAVNKTQTLCVRPRERDYVDLYCILKQNQWDIDTLISDAEKKFSVVIDPLQATKNFLKVVEIIEYPNMLVPFDAKEMHRFYENLATSLKPKILR